MEGAVIMNGDYCKLLKGFMSTWGLSYARQLFARTIWGKSQIAVAYGVLISTLYITHNNIIKRRDAFLFLKGRAKANGIQCSTLFSRIKLKILYKGIFGCRANCSFSFIL